MSQPDPAVIIQMLLGALRYYKTKYAKDLLAMVVARVCDEMGIDRKSFCTLVLEEPEKTKTK
jgi:3-polyprenyl-4-hydroxybenzoate decarboxylase